MLDNLVKIHYISTLKTLNLNSIDSPALEYMREVVSLLHEAEHIATSRDVYSGKSKRTRANKISLRNIESIELLKIID